MTAAAKKLAKRTVEYALTGVLSLVVLVPLAIVFLSSIKTRFESAEFNLALPGVAQWENYLKVIKDGKLGHALINSLILSLSPTVLVILFSSMSSFVIARNKTRFTKAMYTYFFLGLIAPLNYTSMIGVMKVLHLLYSFPGAILAMTAAGTPFITFLFTGFISAIPREMDEAAIIDGCGTFNLFFRVIFPLLKPVTITAFVLNFLGCWNDFMAPLFILNRSTQWGMILTIYNYFGQFRADWNLVCAVIVLTIAPIMVVYVAGQRYIVSGMTAGALKG